MRNDSIMRYYQLTINTKGDNSILEKVTAFLPNPPRQTEKRDTLLTLEFYAQPEEIQKLEKKLKTTSLKYLILAKKLPKETSREEERPEKIVKKIKPKAKLKEIEKRLEEILKEV